MNLQPSGHLSMQARRKLADTATDTELITACLNGNEQAWELLIRRYARLIYSVPLRFNLSEADSADVFQSVCLTLYRKLASVRDQTRLPSWLLTTASRHSLDLINRRKLGGMEKADREAEAELDMLEIPDSAYDNDMRQLEDSYLVRQAISQLHERCQQVIWQLFFNPVAPSYTDIAAQTGISPTAVSVYRSRCLEHLRRILEKMDFSV